MRGEKGETSDVKRVGRGWIRLGLVLTLAWTLAVVGYVIYEWRFVWKPDSVFFAAWPDNTSSHSGFNDDPIPLIVRLKLQMVAAAIGAPVACVWFLILVVGSAIRWILDGFKE